MTAWGRWSPHPHKYHRLTQTEIKGEKRMYVLNKLKGDVVLDASWSMNWTAAHHEHQIQWVWKDWARGLRSHLLCLWIWTHPQMDCRGPTLQQGHSSFWNDRKDKIQPGAIPAWWEHSRENQYQRNGSSTWARLITCASKLFGERP